MLYTTEDAKKKFCYNSTVDRNGELDKYCQADECMAWRWIKNIEYGNNDGRKILGTCNIINPRKD